MLLTATSQIRNRVAQVPLKKIGVYHGYQHYSECGDKGIPARNGQAIIWRYGQGCCGRRTGNYGGGGELHSDEEAMLLDQGHPIYGGSTSYGQKTHQHLRDLENASFSIRMNL